MPEKTSYKSKLAAFAAYKKILVSAGAGPLYIIFPVISSFVLAALEGVSTALLFPLAKGALALDFSFITTTPVIKHIALKLPPSAPNAV